jgi:hypothetical protein
VRHESVIVMGVPESEEPQPAMTTMFDDREKAFEARYAHDEELKFLALARRDKLFALWAVGRLGLAGAARETLIHDLLAVQGFPKHDAALLRFVTAAFAAAGTDAADAPEALDRLGREAKEQVLHGSPKPVDLSAPLPG